MTLNKESDLSVILTPSSVKNQQIHNPQDYSTLERISETLSIKVDYKNTVQTLIEVV